MKYILLVLLTIVTATASARGKRAKSAPKPVDTSTMTSDQAEARIQPIYKEVQAASDWCVSHDANRMPCNARQREGLAYSEPYLCEDIRICRQKVAAANAKLEAARAVLGKVMDREQAESDAAELKQAEAKTAAAELEKKKEAEAKAEAARIEAQDYRAPVKFSEVAAGAEVDSPGDSNLGFTSFAGQTAYGKMDAPCIYVLQEVTKGQRSSYFPSGTKWKFLEYKEGQTVSFADLTEVSEKMSPRKVAAACIPDFPGVMFLKFQEECKAAAQQGQRSFINRDSAHLTSEYGTLRVYARGESNLLKCLTDRGFVFPKIKDKQDGGGSWWNIMSVKSNSSN